MTRSRWALGPVLVFALMGAGQAAARPDDAPRAITTAECAECHTSGPREALEGSIHSPLDCLDCHRGAGTVPHAPPAGFVVGLDACRACHEDEGKAYQFHGFLKVGSSTDIPVCSDCHGAHDVRATSDPASRTAPAHLQDTCGRCHRQVDLIRKYDLTRNLLQNYEGSIHGVVGRNGAPRAVCTDCHARKGKVHALLSPRFTDSAVNRLNIPETCGRCHQKVDAAYRASIHGVLAARGAADSPVCTTCHGEHGILQVNDPRSPVSPTKVAGETCARCHDSVRLNLKYGLRSGVLPSYIDSYHGLKSKAGDTRVANCASCHGVHEILPPRDPRSRVYPANLQKTCGQCHPDISASLARTPIHGRGGAGLRTRGAMIVQRIYIGAVFVIVGLMLLYVLVDLRHHLACVLRIWPQVRRMRPSEVAQHALLTVSFVVLALTGFALKYDDTWFARLLFGWRGGFELRGTIHRVAAGLFVVDVVWHVVFVSATRRGRQFLADMRPRAADGAHIWGWLMHRLGRRAHPPAAGRFSYVEKLEYWALVWGGAVMTLSGLMLWFDNELIRFLPKGALDIAWVVHFWEAVLATMAIAVWHLYATIFDPAVYPMNPSWLTGRMPEAMYRHEHPAHAEEAMQEDGEPPPP
jgi:cytochrome b subunit of formate dehydrogenase